MEASLIAMLLNLASLGQSAVQIAGTVVDAQGAAVANASIRLEVAGVRVDEVHSATHGGFEFRTNVTGDIRLVVTAPGFAEAAITVSAGATGPVKIELQPAPFFETLNITSSRSDVPQSDAGITMTVFSSLELLTMGPLTIDDALKMVPGFTLSRRTSSRVSNPTAQGMTLRGLGGSGASRSLVLADGVPLNDAFGGWIYWDKIPLVAIDRIEVLRGGGSDLYGADAVGGVVQILTLQPGRTSLRALVEGGTLGTGRGSFFAGGRNGGWNISGAGEWFTTDGYILVAEAERSPIDTAAGSKHKSGLASFGYQATNGWRFSAGGSVFSEDRQNGTVVQVNDTNARQGSGEVEGGVRGGVLSVQAFGGTQGYDQTFSAPSTEPPRASEDLDRIQRVPTRVVGGAAQWLRPWGRHSLLVGADGRWIAGTTVETRFTGGRVLGTSDDGGRQRVGSAFARAAFALSDRLTVVAGVRGDGWHSESHNTSFSKSVGAFNPRASIAYRVGDSGVTMRGSVYRGFRAPTLNELYRGFRLGINVTNPNEALKPERLTAGEGGLLISHGRVSTRVTGFWNVLADAITNVTISTSPALNIRQRQNADKVRSIGVEFEGDVRLPRSVSVGVTSAITDARFKGATSLRDNLVPPIARYNFGLSMRFDNRLWTVSGQLRVTGEQFEDDINTLTLHRATVLDVFGGRTIGRRLTVFVAIENVFDTDYDVGRTPIRTVGLPRAIRAGVRLAYP